jgi:hypothetical protein
MLNTGDRVTVAQSNVGQEAELGLEPLLNNSRAFITFLCVDEVQSSRLSINFQISSNRKVRISSLPTFRKCTLLQSSLQKYA